MNAHHSFKEHVKCRKVLLYKHQVLEEDVDFSWIHLMWTFDSYAFNSWLFVVHGSCLIAKRGPWPRDAPPPQPAPPPPRLARRSAAPISGPRGLSWPLMKSSGPWTISNRLINRFMVLSWQNNIRAFSFLVLSASDNQAKKQLKVSLPSIQTTHWCFLSQHHQSESHEDLWISRWKAFIAQMHICKHPCSLWLQCRQLPACLYRWSTWQVWKRSAATAGE